MASTTTTETTAAKDDRTAPTGVIVPPPEIRDIIEKTAQYVSRTNKDFEDRIRENERSNPKFSFLNPLDPYYRYYEWRLDSQSSGPNKSAQPGAPYARTAAPQSQKPAGPPEPPPYLFSGTLPPISAQDLDVLRLTALFVARHGLAFQKVIADREARNYQFDFLRPNHSLYPYFQEMVAQYNRVLLPTKEMQSKIRRLAEDRETVLEEIRGRVDWQKYILAQEKKDKEEAEREKLEYNQIDWHDFTVVATIEFTNADDGIDLPPPTSLADLEYASLEQKRLFINYDPDTRRLEAMPEDNPYAPKSRLEPPVTAQPTSTAPAVQEVDMEISDEEDEMPQPKALPVGLAAGMKIRPAGYTPARGKSVITQVCPNCGERIPVDELEEHMRIELLDPRYKEQKAVADRRAAATNLGGADVARNVKRLAERRDEGDNKRQRSYMDR